MSDCSFKSTWTVIKLVCLCLLVSLPSVELGCGLGVTLVLMLLLFVVYHVFWLELLLLYRSWFGTDERHTGKQQVIPQVYLLFMYLARKMP